jgi:glycosyltransferase involved in cell wall biosynthesis
MPKILYDLTLGFRGKSGIPSDCRALARTLMEWSAHEIDLLVFPFGYVPRGRRLGGDTLTERILAFQDRSRSRFRMTGGCPKHIIALTFLQALSTRRNLITTRLNAMCTARLLGAINLPSSRKCSLNVAHLAHPARTLRPSAFGNFRLDTSNYDVFIQSHVDPLVITSSTLHFVRLHDLLPLTHPHFFDPLPLRIYRKGLDSMMRQEAICWVANSEASAASFREHCGNSREITVVNNPVAIVTKREDLGAFIKQNQFLMVNTLEPRKNIRLAIDGFLQAKSTRILPDDFRLVICGGHGWREETLKDQLCSADFGSDVIFREEPDDAEIRRLYGESRFVLSASLGEGFGLPPLEGMAYGSIPVVSAIPSHHELLGKHAIYFENSIPSLTTAIQTASNLRSDDGFFTRSALWQHVNERFGGESIRQQCDRVIDEKLEAQR